MKAQHESRWFGCDIGPGGILIWPATLLARSGMKRTWPLLALAVTALLATTSALLWRKRLAVSPLLGVALPVVYSLFGASAFRHITVPLPTVTERLCALMK